jgi:TetR/AcrR family transcriptional regulator, mexJK operon transcriptional repressor
MPATARRTSPEQILDAAYDCFARYGYRRTSVEDLARAAGISRPSVYAHFANKDEVFRAVSRRVHEDALADAETAMAASGSFGERLAAVLDAKYGAPLAALQSSPHARELLDEDGRVAGDIAADTNRRYARLLRRLTEEAVAAGEIDPGRAGLGTRQLADLIADCPAGLERAAVEDRSPGSHRRRLAQLAALAAGVTA